MLLDHMKCDALLHKILWPRHAPLYWLLNRRLNNRSLGEVKGQVDPKTGAPVMFFGDLRICALEQSEIMKTILDDQAWNHPAVSWRKIKICNSEEQPDALNSLSLTVVFSWSYLAPELPDKRTIYLHFSGSDTVGNVYGRLSEIVEVVAKALVLLRQQKDLLWNKRFFDGDDWEPQFKEFDLSLLKAIRGDDVVDRRR